MMPQKSVRTIDVTYQNLCLFCFKPVVDATVAYNQYLNVPLLVAAEIVLSVTGIHYIRRLFAVPFEIQTTFTLGEVTTTIMIRIPLHNMGFPPADWPITRPCWHLAADLRGSATHIHKTSQQKHTPCPQNAS